MSERQTRQRPHRKRRGLCVGSAISLERVQLRKALLLFLLARRFVAQVGLGRLFLLAIAAAVCSWAPPGLDVVHLVRSSGAGPSAAGSTVLTGPTALTTAFGSAAAASPAGAFTTCDADTRSTFGADICSGAWKADRCAAAHWRPVGVSGAAGAVGLPALTAALNMAMFSLVTSGAMVRLGSSRLGSPTCTASTTEGPCLMMSKSLVGKAQGLAAALFGVVLGNGCRGRLGNRAVHGDQPVARVLHMGRHGIAGDHLAVGCRGAVQDTWRASRSRTAPGKPGAIWMRCASPA